MEPNNTLSDTTAWTDFLVGQRKAELQKLLPGYLQARRWFGGKARTIEEVRIEDAFPLQFASGQAYITLLNVLYRHGGSQTYMLPLAFAPSEEAAQLQEKSPYAIVARLEGKDAGALYDASANSDFARALLDAIANERRFSGPSGEITAWPTDVFMQQAGGDTGPLQPTILGAEQSNTSIKYGGRFILKLYRRLEEGTNPDLEVGFFLTEQGFPYIPPLAGAIEYRREGREPVTLGILQGYVQNMGDAWQYTLGQLSGYFTAASAEQADPSSLIPRRRHPLDLVGREVPTHLRHVLGSYLDAARLLGRRTAEMHLALASGAGGPEFAPEAFTLEYQQKLANSMRELVDQACELLSARMQELPDRVRGGAGTVVRNPEEIIARFGPLSNREIQATRTRCHGDYHLGQVLYTGDDFVIIDFEGEPIRSLSERKQKHSPLRDVAGMLRSFHYAAYAALFDRQSAETPQVDPGPNANPASVPSTGANSETSPPSSPATYPENRHVATAEDWADAWHIWVNAAFLDEYLAVAEGSSFLPPSREDLRTLLDSLILEKAVYELIYELNNRPTWVRIPLQGIIQLLE